MKEVSTAANLKQKVSLTSRLKSTSVGMKSLPFIEQFLWHRIILDEAHDAFGPQSFILQGIQYSFLKESIVLPVVCVAILLRIEGRYKWYVSGTPFATGALVREEKFPLVRLSLRVACERFTWLVRGCRKIHRTLSSSRAAILSKNTISCGSNAI